MGNKLKKAAPWIAGIILIWHAYGAVDAGGDSGPKMKESLLRIPLLYALEAELINI